VSSKAMRLCEKSGDQPLSAGDSLVSHTALQENVKRLVMTVISGRNSGESFGILDPDGSYLKTSQGSFQVNLDGFLEKCSGNYPKWGIILGGVVGKLPILELTKNENGHFLLPALPASEHQDRSKGKNFCLWDAVYNDDLQFIPPDRYSITERKKKEMEAAFLFAAQEKARS